MGFPSALSFVSTIFRRRLFTEPTLGRTKVFVHHTGPERARFFPCLEFPSNYSSIAGLTHNIFAPREILGAVAAVTAYCCTMYTDVRGNSTVRLGRLTLKETLQIPRSNRRLTSKVRKTKVIR